MITTTHYEQHGSARRRVGEPVSGGYGAHIDAAHKFQFPARGCDLPRSRQLGRSVTRSDRLSFRTGWAVPPADILAIRTRSAAGLTAEQVAALLDLNIGHHLACKLTDGPEHHNLERLSSRAAVEATEPREASHCAGKEPQGRGNV